VTLDTTTIWHQFSAPLRQFIANRVAQPQDTDDILQEVFIKIHRNLDNLASETRLSSWLYRIARNAVIDYYRQRQSMEELPDQPLELTEPDHPHQDLAACLKPMIDNLPEKYRQALWLTEFEGLSQKALSEQLGLSFSGAKSRVQRGRAQVQAMLAACCHLEFDRTGTVLDHQPKAASCTVCEQNSNC
jgi:RNA polymerase sigma-70 factor (ECF subfamily)